MTDDLEPRRHVFVQAAVQPVDEDGVAASVTGTCAFGIATGICWWQWPWLAANDATWWLWVAVAGCVIGALMIGYTTWRRSRRRQPAAEPVPRQP